MSESTGIEFPSESAAYRSARRDLLEAERALRRQVAAVAEQRRALPPGHAVAKEYVFDRLDQAGDAQRVALSDLFTLPDKSLVLYGLMYDEGALPCPMCTAFLDSFDGVVRHARSQLNIAVVARGSIEQIAAYGQTRGWQHLPLLSSAQNSFNQDYFAELGGSQVPMINVFRMIDGQVHHAYTSELFFAGNEAGQDPRHMDMLYPLWNLFDLTAEGRPADWYPSTAD